MGYDIEWVLPTLRRPSRLWNLASSITVAAVGIFSKILIGLLNRSTVYNGSVMWRLLDERPAHVPLITVSNHHSCFDDPGMWGTLKLRHLVRRAVMRWSLAAHDICFSSRLHARFFALGRCVPVVRGKGVHQPALDYCLERLAAGEWLHVFPEGKVNATQEEIRLKWGVGRLIFEAPITPVVVPVWHVGMEYVLPNQPPYRLRLGQKLTFNYGAPLDLSEMVRELRETNTPPERARKLITDHIQTTLRQLKTQTEKLHALANT